VRDVIEPEAPHIVVLGAGYAGGHAATAATRAGAAVAVIDPDGLHGFLPRLAGVAAGRLRAGDARAPLAELMDVRVLHGRAVHLDVDARAVVTDTGDRIRYDAIVVTVGATSDVGPVPGAAEHAWRLHTPGDALALRPALIDADALVVVGGGATGVQLAAEVAAAHDGMPVTLVEAMDRLLSGEPPSLRRLAARHLRRVGVTVHLDAEAAVIDDAGVERVDGTRHDGLVVWAGGWEADPGALLPDAPLDDGRIAVAGDCQVPEHPRVLAAGDIAAHRDVFGRRLAMSAQVALQAGAAAGRTAVAVARDQPTDRVRILEIGRLIDLGERGLGRVGPVTLGWGPSARLVPLLHLGIDARHLYKLGGPLAVLGHAPGFAGAHDPGGLRDPLRAVG
jgi:NADH:ubiquinone reductase (H+-translocating)